MHKAIPILCIILCLLFISSIIQAKDYDRFDKIPLIAETMFPKGNPSETYDYFYLPFCSRKGNNLLPEKPVITDKKEAQEANDLDGSKVKLTYSLPFGIMQKKETLCIKYMSVSEIKRLMDAIQRKFRIIAYYDDLPLAIPIGVEKDKQILLFRHLDFHFKYNGKNVIEARIIPSSKKVLDLAKFPLDFASNAKIPVKFTYSTYWTPTLRNYEDRLRTQQQRGFVLPDSTPEETALLKSLPYETEIQWMSILVSFALAVVLTITIGCIVVRHMWSQVAKYNTSPFELLSQKDDDLAPKPEENPKKNDDIELTEQKTEEIPDSIPEPKKAEENVQNSFESGWKLIAADVFRFPKLASLIPPVLGNGFQLLLLSIAFLVLSTITSAIAFYFELRPGFFQKIMIVLYLLTTGVSGFVSTSIYKKLGGKSVFLNEILTLLLFVVPVVVIWMILNTIAILYQSTAAMPFKSIAFIAFVYLTVSFPALFIGSRISNKFVVEELSIPIKPKPTPSPIKPYPWYKRQLVRFFISGLFPFSAIYIELYYVWLSVWGHTIYAPFAILLICFLLLLVVVSCSTIATTYLQIIEEDHHWAWNSFWNGSAIAFFIFLYSIQFYLFESGMNSFLQLSYYFGYNLLLCFGFGLMMGSVGLVSSFLFLKFIFSQIKVE